MLAYKGVFDALAVGETEIAQELCERMGGRREIEEEHDHPFDRCLGYTPQYFVAGSREQMARTLADFTSICRSPDNANFAGYASTFEGLLHEDSGIVQKGLAAIVKGHRGLIKRGGEFHGTEDELVCVWGVGMANLARWRGLAASGVPPLIPNELLC